MVYAEVIKRLKSVSNHKELDSMKRYGIRCDNALGISIYVLRDIAKEIGKDHQLAAKLWLSGIREARLLATMVDEWDLVTSDQMDEWVTDFDSWDICDQCISNLFDKTPYAYVKAVTWIERREEFVKRAGFVMMAALAVHDKTEKDRVFEAFLPKIIKHSTDERNFVKKAVNWALRQIGKRNKALNRKAISCAKKIEKKDSKSAKWIAKDAIRELTSDRVKDLGNSIFRS